MQDKGLGEFMEVGNWRRKIEKEMLREFEAHYGVLPFANLRF